MPGAQVSEILAMQWREINFGELTMRVSRGVIDGVVDEVKSEYSEDDLPLDPDLETVQSQRHGAWETEEEKAETANIRAQETYPEEHGCASPDG